jgi:mono/diheme cytochrome c family protein
MFASYLAVFERGRGRPSVLPALIVPAFWFFFFLPRKPVPEEAGPPPRVGSSTKRSGALSADTRSGRKVASGKKLYRQHCARCHDKDGTGAQVRESMPEIPDFTDSKWHAKRRDLQLIASILGGKRAHMRHFAGN